MMITNECISAIAEPPETIVAYEWAKLKDAARASDAVFEQSEDGEFRIGPGGRAVRL
jgi:hypothetical protein